MTVKEIVKKLTPAKKKWAAKFSSAIREFEEEKKGCFVAFVDEGPDSWDLKLVVDPKTLEVKEFNCDCSSRAKFCTHKLALLLSISQGKQSSASAIGRKLVSKRLTPAEKLLEKIDDDDKVLEWLVNRLNADKVLLMSMENDLLRKEKIITKASLLAQYKLAYKTAYGKKKSIAVSELPKILELLKPDFEAAVTYVVTPGESSSVKSDAAEIMNTLLSLMQQLRFLTKRPTTRSQTFFKKIVEQSLKQIPNDKKFIGALIEKLAVRDEELAQEYDPLFLLIDRYGLSIDYEIIVAAGMKIFKHKSLHFFKESFLIKYLDLFVRFNLFINFIRVIRPIYAYNKFNYKILDMYLKLGEYKATIQQCESIIASYTPKYQEPYYQYMLKAALASDDTKLLYQVHMSIHNNFPSLDNYIQLVDLSKTKAQKAKLKKLSEAIVVSSNYGYYRVFAQIKFYYWGLNQNYEAMLKKIKDNVTGALAIRYQEELWSYDHKSYILAMAKVAKKYTSFFGEDNDLKEAILARVREKIKEVGLVKIVEENEGIGGALEDLGF